MKKELVEVLRSEELTDSQKKIAMLAHNNWLLYVIGTIFALGGYATVITLQQKTVSEHSVEIKSLDTRTVKLETIVPEIKENVKDINRKLDRLIEIK